MSTKKQNFLYGATILLISNIFVKIIGACFKIPLQHIVGDEVMGYYNSAYQIYALFFMISTAGLPVAVSKMIAQSSAKGNEKEVRKIFRIAIRVFAILGIILFVLMAVFAKPIANLSGSSDRFMVMLAIAPSVFFISLVSAYRGYYQGLQNMIPTSISQVIEAATKLILGLLVGLWATKQGYRPPVVATFVIGAVTVSVILSFLYLLFKTKRNVSDSISAKAPANSIEKTASNEYLLKRLIAIAIPITISASILNLTSVIDSLFVVKFLQNLGYTEAVSESMYGAYTTMSVTIFNMPPTLIYPFSISILPMISAALALGENKKIRDAKNTAFRVVSIIVFPAAFGVGMLSKPILSLLFSNKIIKGTDIYPIDIAGPALSILSLSIFFVGMISITGSMLQAHGYEKKSIISNGLGVLAKFIFDIILLQIPSVGIYGAPISTTICYLVMLFCNIYFLARYTHYLPSIRNTMLKPFIAALACGISALLGYSLLEKLISPKLSVIIAIIIAAVVYFAALVIIRGINKEDLKLFPKGDKLCALFMKFHIIK